jgi:hypothetical protein
MLQTVWGMGSAGVGKEYGGADAPRVNIAYSVEHILAPLRSALSLICPELRMTMDRRPEYSPMPSIREMIQDPHAPEHGPCNQEYTLCDSTHRIFEYSVTTHAMFSSCTSVGGAEFAAGGAVDDGAEGD